VEVNTFFGKAVFVIEDFLFEKVALDQDANFDPLKPHDHPRFLFP
jgi:hypothetical protein